MKIILIIFFTLASFNICLPQKKSKYNSNQFFELKIITIGNDDNYCESSLRLVGIIDTIRDDSIKLFNSDTLIKKLNKKKLNDYYFSGRIFLRIRTPINYYDIDLDYLKDSIKISNTISYVLNYNLLRFYVKYCG